MQHVFRVKPTSIEDLKHIVEDFLECIDPEMVKRACASTRQRFEMLRMENGGRFEHKKNALKPLFDGDHQVLNFGLFRQFLFKKLIFVNGFENGLT